MTALLSRVALTALTRSSTQRARNSNHSATHSEAAARQFTPQITRMLQTHPANYPHVADTTQFVADTQAQTPERHPNATKRNATQPNATPRNQTHKPTHSKHRSQ